MRVTVILILTGALRTVPKDLEKELEELEIGETNHYHPNYSIVKIG